MCIMFQSARSGQSYEFASLIFPYIFYMHSTFWLLKTSSPRMWRLWNFVYQVKQARNIQTGLLCRELFIIIVVVTVSQENKSVYVNMFNYINRYIRFKFIDGRMNDELDECVGSWGGLLYIWLNRQRRECI